MKIFKYLSLIAAFGVLLTGCIEETIPQNGTATSDQIGASSSALEAALNGLPTQMSQGYYVYGNQTHETDMAYPATMIAMTEMMGDMYPLGSNTGYDWYLSYNQSTGMGPNSYPAYLTWFTYYRFIKAANDIIASVDIEDESVADNLKGMAGVAYASRAFYYYMLTVLFEPFENDYTDISKVKGLTVPFVLETTTGEEAKNNPRVPHDEMIEFILSDLQKAEKVLQNYQPSSRLFPDLSVVYGIMAKVYLWDEQYAEAATYARKAIDTFGGQPMTAAQLTDVNTGFNTANQAWMWYLHYSAENMGNLCNFTGWMASEAQWGYSSLTRPGIDRSLYDKIAATDYRKPQFLDPLKYDFYDYKTAAGRDFIEEAPAYLSIKFRCVGGDTENYATGAACDVPVMRVEEMYLIEAEAVGASQGVAAGMAKLSNFMKSYRQPDYRFTTTDLRDFQLEVLTQMRIEFWGEGNAFPSAKRLRPDVIQNYEGTNASTDNLRINFRGIKPNWNMVIPMFEVEANVALEDTNNPDPSGVFQTPAPIGGFCAKK